MKKFSGILFLLLIILSFTSAQNYNLTGAGARAEGFGGAFIGIADDATAIVWNPAGLTQLERPEASVVTRFIHENVTSNYSDNAGSESTSENQNHFSLNFGSFATPLSKGDVKIVGAIAFQRQLDMYYKSKNEYSGYTQTDEQKGGANTITPGLAVMLNQMISLGVSANIWTGTWNSKSTVELNSGGSYETSLDVKFSGFNLVVGGLLDFERKQNGFPLKLGLTVRTPFVLKAEVQDLPVTLEINMPFMLGLGGSYRIGDNFTLALDYEIRSYADKKITANGIEYGNISESNKNLNELRTGIEYLVVLESAVIPLRIGFKTVPTVLSDENVTYNSFTNELEYWATDKQVVGSAISMGSGFITNSFALDITYSQSKYTQNYDTSNLVVGSTASTDFTNGTISTSLIIYF